MPTSQYNVYASSDAGAPQISGAANTLILVLDAVLVNGYGSKAAAGWTKPIANAGNVGHYKQGAGSGFFVHINDNGPNGTSTFKEAWATGWESMTAITAPVGAGGGQFPLPAQLLTTGHVVIPKSNAVDATTRAWVCFADASTFMIVIDQNPAGGVACGLYFGDIYSHKTTLDVGKALIIGSSTENATNTTLDGQVTASTGAGSTLAAHYMPRTWGGGGGSIQVGKAGNLLWTNTGGVLSGGVPMPNGPDNSILLTPLLIQEAAGHVRGRLRGMYMAAHPVASFSSGQVITGTGDYSGKTFQVAPKFATGGLIFVDISNTLETN